MDIGFFKIENGKLQNRLQVPSDGFLAERLQSLQLRYYAWLWSLEKY